MFRQLIYLVSFVLVLTASQVGQAAIIADFDGCTAGNGSENTTAANLNAGTAGGTWTVITPGHTAQQHKIQAYFDAPGNLQFQLDGPRLGDQSIPFDYQLDFDSTLPLGGSSTLSFDAACRRAGAGIGRNGLIIGYDASGKSLFELVIDGFSAATRGTIGLVGQPASSERLEPDYVNPPNEIATTDMTTITIVLGATTFDVIVGDNTAYSGIGYTDTVTDLSGLRFTGSGPRAGYAGYSIDNIVATGINTKASRPSPADGATDVLRDGTVLSWTPGEFAAMHDVYFGPSFDDVKDANDASAVYLGRQAETAYALDRLELGRTYYWRVDEVNAPPDATVFKGNVWSFTVEPIGYRLPSENITATASSSFTAAEGPENTINGSGLDDNDLHSNKDQDMWLSNIEPLEAWIQYEFDKTYKLHEMWAWNSNKTVESIVGLGARDVTIEYSVNGTDWIQLADVPEFARAPGATGYAYNTTVDLGGAAAKYVKITVNSNWGGLVPQYGLSEVRFFYIPLRATEPYPKSGAVNTDLDVTLNFRAGREAAQHDVYLGTDEQAVIDGTAPVTTVTETSYGPLSLDLSQTYYWKINEVNMAETPTTLEGDVWNFATREFLVVDDFESYNDLDPDDPESNRIFNAWIDGYEQPANGSIVGYAQPPFAEQDVVHSGVQSMPLFYDNTAGATYSEATRTIDALRDWTRHGIKTLSLWFRGDPNNAITEQMYAKLNGSKVLYDGEAASLTRTTWQAWNIELADFGVNLTNITELSIGFERSGLPGGKGVVYFDDIRLYAYDRQLVMPAEPSTVGLAAHYELEGTANDSSGNARHGTIMGNQAFVAGKVGQAISLDGFNDFVEITGYKGILGPNAVTVTAWINTTSTGTGTIVGWGANTAGQRFGFRVNDERTRMENGGGNVQGDSSVSDGQWHHVAVTVQASATISYPDVILYVDGIDDTRATTDPDAFDLTADQDVRIGSRPSNNDRFFIGSIDDVRIYDRALTQEEIAWLAGRTQPFDKPF